MAEINTKPNGLTVIWGELGEFFSPTVEKIRRGWVVEIPPHQWFNWFFNLVSRALAHINQRGISEWDNETEYLAKKSYVQDSDGVIYRALLDSKGSDPKTDRVHWEVAFVSSDNPQSRKDFIGWIALSGSISAQPNYKYYFTSSGVITLPSKALRGDSVEVGTSPNVFAEAVVEGGRSIRTKLGDYTEIDLNIEDTVNFVFDGTMWEVN